MVNGAVSAGIILGAVTVFVIERKLLAAAAFAAAGAVFTFVGLMHGERVGITPHPEIAAGYALVALFFVA
jgi:AGZA family xanthine/uracil permease-like MFS transporter